MERIPICEIMCRYTIQYPFFFMASNKVKSKFNYKFANPYFRTQDELFSSCLF